MNRDELRDAVVGAAIRWREQSGQYGSDVRLEEAVDAYLFADYAPALDLAPNCSADHGVGHVDCPKCWHLSPRNPNAHAGASIALTGEPCSCSREVREYCASVGCHGGDDILVWIERTWVDVRQWDIVRPPGNPDAVAQVIKIGPVTPWHVNHAAGDAAQYRPNEHLAEWSARAVTLLPSNGSGVAITPELGMRPEAPVEIQVSAVELDAILLLGGWECRVEASP